MIPEAVLPVVRRAIIDLLNDIGGEHNDHELSILLTGLGHRIARRYVAEQIAWLAEEKLVKAEQLGPYVAARILPDGIEIAEGRLVVEGVWRHKTGE